MSANAPTAQAMSLSLDVEAARAATAEALPHPDIDPELDAKATQFADALASVDPADARAQTHKKTIEEAGRELQRKSGHRSRMLEEPIKALSQRGADGGEVGRALVDLKVQVEELDPTRFDFDPGFVSRIAGYLPFVGTPLKRYFSQYESAQTVIDAILKSLELGREQLGRDNVTLSEDQKIMRELTGKLEKQIQLLQLVDQKLAYKLEREIPATDKRHAFISEELLFPLRQRVMDLQQQLAVNQQGFLAIELIVRNNKELIRGVNRALDVTVSALQVAVTVALGLAHQKIVLDKVNALNTTTSDLISGTAERLRTQGTEIHKQASSAMLDMDALRSAFSDIHAALDEVSRFRSEALPRMAEQIDELDRMTGQAEETINRLEQGNQAQPRLDLDPN
ncbi:MAG: toxic anion resistance protein [Myxococcota bacterium]|nr:toxic anion resistance protein [Myxococcota bacterium]